MRIDRVRVDRFGILAEQEIESLSSGCNIFLGHNEAGKSTTMAFFRAMLFGYKRGNSSLDPFMAQSRKASVAGGSLFLHSQTAGDITLVRRPLARGKGVEIFRAGGEQLAEEEFYALLGSITPDVYDNVFAFNLRSLMDATSLDGDSVRHALHAAAFGLKVAPGAALKQLGKRADDLLKQDRAGVSAPLNNLVAQLDVLEQELATVGEEAALYRTLRAELEETRTQRDQCGTRRAALFEQKQNFSRRIGLWPQYEALLAAQGSMAALAGVEGPAPVHAEDFHAAQEHSSGAEQVQAPSAGPYCFAPDALVRLESLLRQQEERTVTEEAASLRLQRLVQELGTLGGQTASLVLAGEVQALQEQVGGKRAMAEQLPLLRQTCQQLAAQQQEGLERLGWEEAQLVAVDVSVATREQLHRWEKELAALGEEAGRTQLEAQRLEAQQQTLGAELAEHSRAVQEQPEDAALPTPLEGERFSGKLAQAEAALASLDTLVRRVDEGRQAFARALHAVHPQWTEQRLASADTTSRARALCREYGEALHQARRSQEKETERLELAKLALQETREEAALGETRLQPFAGTPAEEEAEKRLSLARALERTVAALRRERVQYDEADRMVADMVAPPRQQQQRWFLGPVGLVAFVLLSFAVASGFFALRGGEGMFAWVAAGLGLAAVGALVLARRAAGVRASVQLDAGVPAMNVWCQTRSRAKEALERFEEEGTGLVRSMEGWCPFALPEAGASLPDETAVGTFVQTLERMRARAALAERERRELEMCQQRVATAVQRVQGLEELVAAATTRYATAAEVWGRQLAALGLEASTPVDEVPAFFERVEAARLAHKLLQESSRLVAEAEGACLECLHTAHAMPFFAVGLTPWAVARCAGHHAAARQSIEDIASVQAEDQKESETLFAHQPAGRQALEAALAGLAMRLVALHGLREQAVQAMAEGSTWAERQRQFELVRASHAKAVAAATACQQALAKGKAQWQQWLAGQGFSAVLSPETAKEAFALALTLRERKKQWEAAQQEGKDIAASLWEYIQRVAALAQRAGVVVPQGLQDMLLTQEQEVGRKGLEQTLQEAVQVLYAVAELVEASAQAKARMKALEEQRTALEAEKQGAGVAAAVAAEKLTSLMADAGVSSQEDFRRRFALWQQREQHASMQREIMAAFYAPAHEERTSVEAYIASFEQYCLADLEVAHEEATAGLHSCEAELTTLAERGGTLEEGMRRLAADGGTSALRQKEATLREQLEETLREWRVATMARQLLLVAKNRVEGAGQQGVVGMASALFRAITQGEYEGLCTGEEEERFYAMHRSGERKDAEKALSQGTREQFYLALRLAYIQNHTANAESVPVCMDDILVNADPARAGQTAAALGAFGQANQLLYFTCHPQTAEVLVQAALQANGQANVQGSPAPRCFVMQSGAIRAASTSFVPL
ncbi:AAA family ATPase [Desulfovibrio cuneatus]|uniref:AAA family ATPase n=1 Tax=Desulfovibrio cuneatus TaxID=159728 RepID=UPI0003FB1519|nr:AAA family ATPase [Desulfovibrio cuneatus]